MSATEAPVLGELVRERTRTELWERLYPIVQRMVRQALGLPLTGPVGDDDEDLVAEAVYRALTAVTRYRSGFRGRTEGEARGWLWVVCRNAARREARRHHARRRSVIAVEPSEAVRLADGGHPDPPADPWPASDALAVLSRAVPNETWRRMWLLSEQPGAPRSSEEIAAELERTPASVTVTLSRVRQAIRRYLAAACL